MTSDLINAVENSPTVRLKPKIGRWVEYSNNGWVACSECETAFPKLDRFPYMNYCGYCGCKMVEKE